MGAGPGRAERRPFPALAGRAGPTPDTGLRGPGRRGRGRAGSRRRAGPSRGGEGREAALGRAAGLGPRQRRPSPGAARVSARPARRGPAALPARRHYQAWESSSRRAPRSPSRPGPTYLWAESAPRTPVPAQKRSVAATNPRHRGQRHGLFSAPTWTGHPTPPPLERAPQRPLRLLPSRRRRRRRRFARPRARRAPPLNTTHCGGRHEEARHRAPAGWKGRGFLRARRRRGVRTAGGTPRRRGWRLALRLFGYRWCECTHLLPNKLWYFTLLPATGPTWGETGLPAAPGTP